MTSPNFGSQPGQGTQQGWIPPAQQQIPQQQPQAPQQQPFNPQTTVFQAEPHVQMPAPYFPPPQQQQQGQQPQPSQQIYPNQPQYAPAWQGGQQQPQPGQQPQQQPWQRQQQQQQQAQPAPAQNIQFDAQGRMFGPGLPQELQGKTMNEAVQFYGMMRQGYIQSQIQQPQQQRQQQQQPTPTQQGQVQAGARAASPWTDPEGFFGRVIEEKLQAILGPTLQDTAEASIERVRNQVAAAYPVYTQYEPQVLQKLQGLPVETLRNPEAWRLALSAVIGEQQLAGGQQPQNGQQRPQVNANGQPQLPWGSPMPIATLPWQQAPQQHQAFFSESPSAVMQGGYQPGDQPMIGQAGLTPQQKEVARRFGISEQQYLQGMGIR